MDYNLQFEKLIETLQLGEIISIPKVVSGGFLHRMYAIETTSGKYAVKALNPQILLRPTAKPNVIRSEQIANLVANSLPAHPAKICNAASLHEIDNQFYLVFDWVEGKSLIADQISVVHCDKIARILAEIHKMDFSELEIIKDVSNHVQQQTDWKYYLQKGLEHNEVWVNQLQEVIENLYNWKSKANKAAEVLESSIVISHGDLDPKNVLWNQEMPIVIDWESAGYRNPMQELIETAIYWSADNMGNIDQDKFKTFINGYKERYGTLQADWRMVLESGLVSKLDWLEYCLKRSLWIECSNEEEQQLGTVQVMGTIDDIKRYEVNMSNLEVLLNELMK